MPQTLESKAAKPQKMGVQVCDRNYLIPVDPRSLLLYTLDLQNGHGLFTPKPRIFVQYTTEDMRFGFYGDFPHLNNEMDGMRSQLESYRHGPCQLAFGQSWASHLFKHSDVSDCSCGVILFVVLYSGCY